MDDGDEVFRALADRTRRLLLDLLFARDGQDLGQLVAAVEAATGPAPDGGGGMTRFGVAKHLGVLESAGLVTTHKEGRRKLHFLNPVPIRLVHDRWIGKFAERRVAALADLKHQLEHDQEQP